MHIVYVYVYAMYNSGSIHVPGVIKYTSKRMIRSYVLCIGVGASNVCAWFKQTVVYV